ncbi:TonB-dependent receptor [Sphingomonas solaris]|uniref:TonB-dependent receptor n=2 Tax=Alterirhizorhabdus solaris TaxID=2529389 RepID=A0A558RC91_9SPHN|nr:TonB-dependent receptor [Sphingomonas solaris]
MLAGVAAMPAAAQTTTETAVTTSEPVGSDEIVVTGSRRSTTLQDAPININAVTADTLARARIDDVRSLAAFTPGMTVVDTGPASTGTIVLRGINSGDTSSDGNNANNTIGVYLGEVPLYLDFKLIDIARVEVLQGPQGTLYGLGTLAGAVRYIPNRPTTDRFSIDVHGRGYAQSHSENPGGVGDVAINVPILEDHIAFRTSTGYYRNAGFIDYNNILQQPGVSDPQPVRSADANAASLGTAAQQAANFRREKDLNYERTFTTRNQLLLEYNPDLKLYLTYAHQQTKTGGRQANIAGVLGTGRYEAPFRYEEPYRRNANLYAAELNVNVFDFAQLVSTTAYTEQKNRDVGDNTDLLLDLDYGYEAFPEFSSFANNQQRYKQFNEEIRLVSSHGGPFNWVLGGFYNRQKFHSDRQEYVPGFAGFAGVNRPDDLEYISFVDTKTTEKAVYGEGTLHITEAWQVTGGLRYYKYDAEARGGSDLPLLSGGLRRTPFPLIQFAPERIASPDPVSADGFVWKANTSYKFSNDLLVYGTYSTGYRVGGVNRVPACTPSDYAAIAAGSQALCALPDEITFSPDKTRNMEVGVRAALFDKRIQFTLAGFRVNWNGIQVPSTTINGAIGITKNGSKARSQGIEFSTTVRVTPEFVVQGTYSYVDAKLTRRAPALVVVQDPGPGFDTNLFDGEPGDRLPGSTKNSGSIQGTYTHPLGDGRSIEANWATTYTGSVFSRVGLRGFGTRIPSYVMHRAAVTYRTDAFDVGLFADNIFDKYAVTSVGNDRSSLNRVRDAFGSVAGQGVVERFYAQSVLTPRRVGVEFRYHY